MTVKIVVPTCGSLLATRRLRQASAAASAAPTTPAWPAKYAGRSSAGERSRGANSAKRSLTAPPRSEEHTSELQSLTNLVCRLLLEKKKTERQRKQGTPAMVLRAA